MIAIFVSSTFNDMQAERDTLHQMVLPVLRNYVASYGETIRLVDLRWGVDTTDLLKTEITPKVVRTCLNAIDFCDDFIIAFLGTRYGKILTDVPEGVLDEYGLKIDSPISMTELEIRYGILNKKNRKRAIVFVRDDITGLSPEQMSQFYDSDNRVKSLIHELQESDNCFCRHYSLECIGDNEFFGLSDLSKSIVDELTKIIKIEYEGHHVLNIAMEMTHNLFEAFITEKMYNYLPIPDIMTEIKNFQEGNDSILVVEGESGMGKSALSAWLNKEIINVKVIPFFCGLDNSCIYPAQILDYFIYEICEILLIPNNALQNVENKRQMFTSLLYETKGEVWLLVDAIDQLHVSSERILDWMPVSLPDNIRIIVTTTPKNIACQQLSAFWPVRICSIRQIHDKRQLLLHLFSSENKEINYYILETIISNKKIDSYLYASMLVRSLTLLDRYDFSDINQSGCMISDINEYLIQKIMQLPNSAKDLGLYLIYELGEKIVPNFATAVLSLLSISMVGIRPLDLESLFPDIWNDFKFIEFTDFLHGFLMNRQDGYIDFTHIILKDASKVFATYDIEIRYAKYISKLSDNDLLKIKIGLLQMSKIGAVKEAVSLILHNPKSSLIINQIKEISVSNNVFLRKLLSYNKILDWFLKYALQIIKERDYISRLIDILRALPSTSNSETNYRLYETLGDLYFQDRKDPQAYNYYVLASQCVDAKDENKHSSIILKMLKAKPVNTSDELLSMKNELILLRKTLEHGYLHSIQEKLIYWQCRLIICITKLPQVFIHPSFDFKLHRVKRNIDISYVFLILVSQPKLSDTMIEYELYNIACALSKEIINCFETTDKISYYDIFMFAIKLMEKTEKLPDAINLVRCIKLDFLKSIKRNYNNRMMFIIAEINYYLAVKEKNTDEKVSLLISCCDIWKRYIFDTNCLHAFASRYTEALSILADIYLSLGEVDNFYETILQERNVHYTISSAKVKYALDVCRKYPDEGNYEILEKERDNLISYYRIYVYKYYLKNTFPELLNMCSKISLFHKFTYFARELPAKLTITFPNPDIYERIESIYEEISKKQNKENTEEVTIVKFQIVGTVYRMLGVYENKVSENSEYELLKPFNFYLKKEQILRKLILLIDGEIISIRLHFDLAKTLFELAKYDESGYKIYCNASQGILRELMEKIDEDEIIFPSYEDEELSLYKVQFLYCKISYWLSCRYYEDNNHEMAIDEYNNALLWCIRTYGQADDSVESDQLILYMARSCCKQLLTYDSHVLDKHIDDVRQTLTILNVMD